MDRETFLDVIDSFGMPYEISHDTRDMILVFIPTVKGNSMIKWNMDIEDIEEALVDEGVKIYDIIVEDLRDGVQIGIELY